jgi:hypothetical protein
MNILIHNPLNGWSHMVSDNIKNLHIFAQNIGIKKCWYENKRGKCQPHYDVRESKFQEAVDAGAKIVSRNEIVEFLKTHYK